MTVLVVMGVSGSGKSTIGRLLAARLGWDFAEGDDLHPPANIAKMRAGHPLTDEDRGPWLELVATWIRDHTDDGRSGVITCSALKRRYRDVLRGDDVVFVHLTGTPGEIAHRLAVRAGHFMPPSLLSSQIADLEVPGPDERAVGVDVAADAESTATAALRALGLEP